MSVKGLKKFKIENKDNLNNAINYLDRKLDDKETIQLIFYLIKKLEYLRRSAFRKIRKKHNELEKLEVKDVLK